MSITQAQIAKLAGVSRATVDRVINNRGSVNPEVEKRIKSIIKEHDYTPNPAGRLLVRSKRPMRIAYVLHTAQSAFIQELLTESIDYSERLLATSNISTDFFAENTLDVNKQLKVLKKVNNENYDGVILMPMEDERVVKEVNRIVDSGIPVVTFNGDLEDSKRLCYVGEESFSAGRAAAGLMGLLLGNKGKVLPITGWKNNVSGERRINGFTEEIKLRYPDIELLDVEQTKEDDMVAFSLVEKLLKENEDIKGIYLSANGHYGISNALRRVATKRKVFFVCHDYIRQNIELVKEGLIDFLIDQNSHLQATIPYDILKDYFLSEKLPDTDKILTNIEYRNIYNI